MSTMRFSKIGISLIGFFFCVRGVVSFFETLLAAGTLESSQRSGAGLVLVFAARLVPTIVGLAVLRNAERIERFLARMTAHEAFFHHRPVSTGHPEIDRWRERV